MAPGPRTAGRLVCAICRTPVDAKNRSAVKRVRIKLAFAATLLLLVLAGCAGSSLKPDPENDATRRQIVRSEEHTSELQSLMRISYAVFCLKKKNKTITNRQQQRKPQ